MLEVKPTALDGVRLVIPDRFTDNRGFFSEMYNARLYRELGLTADFVQDNYSHSVQGVLRGLHYQVRHPQAKLISVIHGEIFDVAVDIRRGSPTWGKWVGKILSGTNRFQLYISAGFAHGFCVLSKEVDVLYKCSDFYEPSDDCGILWSDSDIAIDWPDVETVCLSDKDRVLPKLADVPPEHLPVYGRGE